MLSAGSRGKIQDLQQKEGGENTEVEAYVMNVQTRRKLNPGSIVQVDDLETSSEQGSYSRPYQH